VTGKSIRKVNRGALDSLTRQDVATLLSAGPEFFCSFTMIIASNLPPSIETQIGDALWQGKCRIWDAYRKETDDPASSTVGGPDVPLVLIRSSGFVGRIEIQVREHCGRSFLCDWS
jgi:amyloid beta precursor protein binding protein 1